MKLETGRHEGQEHLWSWTSVLKFKTTQLDFDFQTNNKKSTVTPQPLCLHPFLSVSFVSFLYDSHPYFFSSPLASAPTVLVWWFKPLSPECYWRDVCSSRLITVSALKRGKMLLTSTLEQQPGRAGFHGCSVRFSFMYLRFPACLLISVHI